MWVPLLYMGDTPLVSSYNIILIIHQKNWTRDEEPGRKGNHCRWKRAGSSRRTKTRGVSGKTSDDHRERLKLTSWKEEGDDRGRTPWGEKLSLHIIIFIQFINFLNYQLSTLLLTNFYWLPMSINTIIVVCHLVVSRLFYIFCVCYLILFLFTTLYNFVVAYENIVIAIVAAIICSSYYYW